MRARYGFTAVQPSSSIETPSTANPLSLYCCSNSMNQGISTLQGAHQVAQKSSSTTLPLYSDRCTVFPSTSLSTKSGAALRSLSPLTAARTLVEPHPDNEARLTAAARDRITARVFDTRFSFLNYIGIPRSEKFSRNHSARRSR